MFTYQIETTGAGQPSESAEIQGYCCLCCAQQLLASLEQVIMAHWLCAPQPGATVKV